MITTERSVINLDFCVYFADHICTVGKELCNVCWNKKYYTRVERKVIKQHLHRLDTISESQAEKERVEVLKATGKDKEIEEVY